MATLSRTLWSPTIVALPGRRLRPERDVQRDRRQFECDREAQCDGIPAEAHPPVHLPAQQHLQAGHAARKGCRDQCRRHRPKCEPGGISSPPASSQGTIAAHERAKVRPKNVLRGWRFAIEVSLFMVASLCDGLMRVNYVSSWCARSLPAHASGTWLTAISGRPRSRILISTPCSAVWSTIDPASVVVPFGSWVLRSPSNHVDQCESRCP